MQKWKFCQYLLIFMLFQTCMTLFILFDTKDKNRIFELFLSIQWKSIRAHWRSMFEKKTNRIPEKKELHTGLEQHEDDIFWGELSL